MPYPEFIEYSLHGAERRVEHNYTRADVRAALRDGEIIEQYEDTGRGPSYLLLHWIDNRPLHVVAADKAKEEKTVVVTLYDPQTRADKWTDDYRRRT